jgi:hypothetical protein
MVHVGVDLHKRMSQIAVLTADGELTQHRLPNDLAHLEPFPPPSARTAWCWNAAMSSAFRVASISPATSGSRHASAPARIEFAPATSARRGIASCAGGWGWPRHRRPAARAPCAPGSARSSSGRAKRSRASRWLDAWLTSPITSGRTRSTTGPSGGTVSCGGELGFGLGLRTAVVIGQPPSRLRGRSGTDIMGDPGPKRCVAHGHLIDETEARPRPRRVNDEMTHRAFAPGSTIGRGAIPWIPPEIGVGVPHGLAPRGSATPTRART